MGSALRGALLLVVVLGAGPGSAESPPAPGRGHHAHDSPHHAHHSGQLGPGGRAVAWRARHNHAPPPPPPPGHLGRQSLGLSATTPSTYTKHQPGRRVCSSEPSLTIGHHSRDRIPRLAFNTDQSGGVLCCPGWAQVTRHSFGCNKPVCSVPCQNGGVCSSPGRCTCPKGFAGNYCQIDVDECIAEKPCDQICRNIPGSYQCYCRDGFQLQPDRHSCRKNDSDGTASEARDLEDDYEEEIAPTTRRSVFRDTENEVGIGEGENTYDELLQRLVKLEKQFAKEKKNEIETSEIVTRISSTIDSINEIRRSIQSMQLMHQEIYELRNKVKLYEFEARKMQHLTNRVLELENRLRTRCRSIYI